jgi:signal transduction histidine kinase
MVGQLIHILIPDDRLSEEENIISSLRKGQRVEHFETIRKRKDGKLLNISLSISPIIDLSGKIIGAAKIARDITQQVQTQNRLRIIHSLGKDMARELTVDKILQMVTDAATELSGAAFGAFFYNKVDMSGEAYMLYALSGAPREAFEKLGMPRNTAVFAMTFEGKGNVRSDDIRKDPRYGHNAPHAGMPAGHLPVVSYFAIPVYSQSGHVIGGLFFGHPDPGMFTEEHELLVSAIAGQAAVALDNAKLYEEIKSLNTKKDEFIGFASHELKTPLTTIRGYMQLGKSANRPYEDIYPKVMKQLDRLDTLVGDFLSISRMQSGKVEYKFESVSINELMREAAESVDVHSHNLNIQAPDEDIKATADYSKLLQVVVNLLSNAVKYSPPGTDILIRSLIFGDEVEISIGDQGVGIPASELKQIFNQFYRVSNNSTSKGYGLGLYIAKEIMEAHMGNIWAESEPGKGSVFYITFPIDRPKAMS